MKKFTKIIAGLTAASALAIGAAAFAACTDDAAANKFGNLNTAEEVYGFSAATAGMLISGINGGSTAQTAVATAAKLGTATEVTDEETIGTLNEYMMLVESLISDGDFEIGSSQNTDEAYAGYDFKMTISYYDINGEKLQYTTYYNQELRRQETEQDDNETEISSLYSIDGVMVIDGIDYKMEGRYEAETEGDETENQHYLKVTIDEAADNYLLVEQESENERGESEIEYVYSRYSAGNLTERTTFEYENERDETEIKMTVNDRLNGTSNIFKFEREAERGKETIKIIVGENNSAQTYTVRVETDANGNTQYVYYRNGNSVGRGNRIDFDD